MSTAITGEAYQPTGAQPDLRLTSLRWFQAKIAGLCASVASGIATVFPLTPHGVMGYSFRSISIHAGSLEVISGHTGAPRELTFVQPDWHLACESLYLFSQRYERVFTG